MKNKIKTIIIGLSALLIITGCIMYPNIAKADSSGTINLQIEVDDSQISWTVPLTVSFAVKGDGTFAVPTNGQFVNNSVFDIHVSNIAVSAGSGVTLARTSDITSSTAADTVGFTITPGSGTAIEAADYVSGAAPATVADWVIAKNGSLATSYTGKISKYGSISPSSSATAMTVTWTAAAGDGAAHYSGPSLVDSSVAVSLTLAQLQEAKVDSAQAANLEAYAQSAKLQIQVPMADSTTMTATLIEDNDAGLTFMTDTDITTMAVNSSGSTANRFNETTLYAALQSGGSVYNLFDSSFLSAIAPQNVKVASVHNEKNGVLTTLSNQTLWLASAYDISGADYSSGYTAGSSAEATFGHQFEGWTNYTAGQSGRFWLRSADEDDSSGWLNVSNGTIFSTGATNIVPGVRPCFTL